MLPTLFEFVLSPMGATVAFYSLAVAVPGFMAWRDLLDSKKGLVPEGQWKRTLLTFGGGALLVLTLVVKPWAASEDISLPIHTYGMMMGLGFVSGIAVTLREAKRTGLSGEHMMDMAFWVILGGLAGARVLFIMVNLDQYFGPNFLSPIAGPGSLRIPTVLIVWRGGMVYYGGFIGAALAFVGYIRAHKLPFWRYADAAITAAPLGQFFGRLGCFAAGCCWGKVCDAAHPFATFFPEGSLAYAQTPVDTHVQHLGEWTTSPVLPTQLFESAATLGIFFILVLLRNHKRFHGMVLIGYFTLYPMFRFFNETLRGDWGRGMLWRFPEADPIMLSTSQLISLLIAAFGVTIMVYRTRQAQGAAGASA